MMICEINLLMVAGVLKMYKRTTMVDEHLCKKRKEKKLAPIGDTYTHTPNNTNNR
jgi:hypothetical protein